MRSAIQDYSIIGDGRSCALIGKSGAIEFLCWPRFDSDSCLAALLGDERHGQWLLSPANHVADTHRCYREDTAILETEHVTSEGRVRVTDLMPWQSEASSIVRVVEGLSGEVTMAFSLRLRFGYGQIDPWRQRHERGLIFEAGPDRVILDCPVEFSLDRDAVRASFRLRQGEKIAFALAYCPSIETLSPALSIDAEIESTERHFRSWIARFKPKGPWDRAIKRSLITLHVLTDRRSGGIVAAATLGLPEVPHGSANWDYRYCWLRDSTFTLTALLNAGFHEEATRWRDWILRAIAAEPLQMQIVYRIDGGRFLAERECVGLPGYRGAAPVRIGNAASGQKQLDVYGELLDTFDVLAKAGIARTPRVVEVETAVVEHLEKTWHQPSADIWENRNEERCYTYSQAMAWVGVTRFLAAHAENKEVDRALRSRLNTLGQDIHRTVCERGYRKDLGHFVQYYGGNDLDASLLLLPLLGFLPIGDPRVAGTIQAIERDLMEEGLVRRKPPRAHGHDEGAFLACSCWLADCYKMQGRVEEAAALLERVIGVSNDVGLLSEEYDVRGRTLTGNFPQALSHLSLINTALFLSGPVIQRAGG